MNEKAAFSQRLNDAIRNAGQSAASPTRLALDFNLRYHGKPVTAQAVRKWLSAGAIPSHDKIVTLADWFDVSPEWLHYGTTTQQMVAKEVATYQAHDPKVWRDYYDLDESDRLVVKTLIKALKKRAQQQAG